MFVLAWQGCVCMYSSWRHGAAHAADGGVRGGLEAYSSSVHMLCCPGPIIHDWVDGMGVIAAVRSPTQQASTLEMQNR